MTFFRKLASAAAWTFYGLKPLQKNKIVVSSLYGKGYSDNPKAIVGELLKRNEDLDIVWLVKPGLEKTLPQGVRAVSYDSPARIRELATAKCWIDNCRKGAPKKRRGQFYLQTWHGLALKRIEKDAEDKLESGYARYAARDSAQTDVIISNCAHMTKIYKTGFWYDGEVPEFGSPRNDMLFEDPAPYREKVRAHFGLPADRKLVLYGPTFRADHSTDAYRIDADSLRAALKDRFGGEWTLLARLHPAVESLAADVFSYDGKTVCNATPYPDIMELLAACDCVVTDYSSLMFDFAITGRPCFQFATDLQAYRKDRNFYFPLSELPFPCAEDNAALAENIRGYSADTQKARWETFNRDFGLVEDGHASERCTDLILKKMKE